MKKFNLFLIACAVSFMGFAQVADIDPGTFAPTADGLYEFQNEWLLSSRVPLANWTVVAGSFTDGAQNRSMVMRDGILYFMNRATKSLDRMSVADGTKLESILLDGHGLMEGSAADWAFTSLATDHAGNIILFNLSLGVGDPNQAWVINTENPANSHLLFKDYVRQMLIDEVSDDVAIIGGATRLDMFAPFGNMLEDGFILAAVSGQHHFVRWNVVGGVATFDPLDDFWRITSMTQPGMQSAVAAANFATMPSVTPINEEFFWFNFNSQAPLLMDMEGNVMQSFIDLPYATSELQAYGYDGEGGTFFPAGPAALNNRFNAPQNLKEFELRGEIFMIVPYGNWTAANGGGTLVLIRFEDEERIITDATIMPWVFPSIGFGLTGSQPFISMGVEVDHMAGPDYGTATIAVFFPNNGVGVYTLKSFAPWGNVNVPGVEAETIDIFVRDNLVWTANEVAEITVFNVLGQQVVSAINTNRVEIPANGIFVVRALTHEGQIATQKVIVR